jgi:L-alanine-DL-glutamate epimerase-like enolase superfamily enzyme
VRITHVECFRVAQPGATPPFAWRRGLLGSSPDGQAAVLRIGTDSGATGVAIATRPGMAAAVEDIVDRVHVGDDVPLMYDGSAGFDLPDAVYLGRALHDAGFLWYEEPMREFSVSAYARLAAAVPIPLLVAETSDGAHMNSADFIAAGAATFGVRAGASTRGGITGAMRTAHLADAFRLRAEVLGDEIPSRHLCMAVPNTTYYESLITESEVPKKPEVDGDGLVHAPTGPGMGLPPGLDYPAALVPYVQPSP